MPPFTRKSESTKVFPAALNTGDSFFQKEFDEMQRAFTRLDANPKAVEDNVKNLQAVSLRF